MPHTPVQAHRMPAKATGRHGSRAAMILSRKALHGSPAETAIPALPIRHAPSGEAPVTQSAEVRQLTGYYQILFTISI